MESNKLLTKYFKGWLNPAAIKDPGGLSAWIKEAEQAATTDYDLMVFKIPRTITGHLQPSIIKEIEQLLQNKLG